MPWTTVTRTQSWQMATGYHQRTIYGRFGGQIWQTRSWDGCGTHRFVWYFCRARKRLDIQTRSGLPERQHGDRSH